MNNIFNTIQDWIILNVLVSSTLIQLSVSVTIFGTAYFISQKPKTLLAEFFSKRWSKEKLDQYNEEALITLVFPVACLVIMWSVTILATVLEMPENILEVIAKLLTAWIVIRLTSSLVKYPVWSKIIAVIAWSVAALSITGFLEPTLVLLDSVAIHMGKTRISALTVGKGALSLVILLWLSGVISKLLERQINTLPSITPSVRVLLVKIMKISLVALALMIVLDNLGIDLTALTVFGGAIGLGLGFGLQKVVSNLVCGVILLLDRSVKPGDVIEVEKTYGVVNSLGARYVSVLTRDGVEHLIPNENLITERVVNWSYSHPNIRLHLPIGISYDSDVNKAMQLLEETARENIRVLDDPIPVCRLIGFGENSIDLQLRIWINDPADGVRNVRSDILLSIWNKFKENGIKFPFPQRDIHIRSNEMIKI